MKKRLFALLMAVAVLFSLCACGGSAPASTVESVEATASEVSVAETVSEAPVQAEDAEETPEAPAEEASVVEETEPEPEVLDFTESNANNDFKPFKEMLTTLHTELPVVDEPVTLTYSFGYETSALAYLPGSDLNNHQIWSALEEITGVNVEVTTFDTTTATDKLNLIIASGDYPDLFNLASYTPGVEAAYEEELIIDLSDYLEAVMPNYWTIINSDQNILREVQDGGMFLCIYPIKDQCANPTDMGAFVRMDWLEDLDMEVPTTYDEMIEVLRAFKTEKGAIEPLSLYNTISMADGLLMGGFGSMAELSTNAMGGGNALNAYYQVDGEVVYGATTDGTRKFLQWLHQLYEEDLIHFENMLNRGTNPFGELTMTACATGTTGYMYSNQPFGGNYSVAAAEQYGDTECNWWPVQDLAEESGATIPFFEETTMIDSVATVLCISSQCEEVEAACRFIDYGYSYEGSLLYNFGYEQGSGHELESWYYDEAGEPAFDPAVIATFDTTSTASTFIATKDLAGVVYDRRLSFEFGERELSCFEAWATNKNNSQILGSSTQLTSEEGIEAAGLYSDIITYVSTSALQFINGDLDINDDATWESYVADIEGMNLDALTDIIQGAYDRANA